MSDAGVSALQPHIESRILLLREQRVMLDSDLATLYGVAAHVLVQAVKRKLARFPTDFMLQLTAEEWAIWRSQSVISSSGHGGRRTAPYAFTEQGVAMLSSMLASDRHQHRVEIEIVAHLRQDRGMAATHQDLAKRLGELEEKTERLVMQHDIFSRNTRVQLKQVFDALRQLITPPEPTKRPIGFLPPVERKKEKPAVPERIKRCLLLAPPNRVAVAATLRAKKSDSSVYRPLADSTSL